MFNLTPKKTVHAVHDNDLEKVLSRLGLFNKFKNGELSCKFCHEGISIKNLHSFFPQSGSVKFACDDGECVRALHAFLEDGEIDL